MMRIFCVFLIIVAHSTVESFQIHPKIYQTRTLGNVISRNSDHLSSLCVKAQTEDIEATTEKYGLEVGLFNSLKKEDGGETAKDLLQKYGVAYLATSIPLALLSFSICYALVDSGVEVSTLLAKIGIQTADTESAKTAGTAAIAYAAHKAASPLRFPPTVALTPLVAKMIGKEPETITTGEE